MNSRSIGSSRECKNVLPSTSLQAIRRMSQYVIIAITTIDISWNMTTNNFIITAISLYLNITATCLHDIITRKQYF